MALYSVDVEKLFQGEYWSNRYIIDVDSMEEGISRQDTIVQAERSIHYNDILFTKARVSNLGTADMFVTVPLNVNGIGGDANGTLLPLFNTLRVDAFPTLGRPSRKFFRGCLGENDISNGVIRPAITEQAASIIGALATAANGKWVDVDGQEFVRVSTFPQVQMRQLRRGSKRRRNPILP